jgi:hypothetical protein
MRVGRGQLNHTSPCYKVREKNRAKVQRKGAGAKQDRDIGPAENSAKQEKRW